MKAAILTIGDELLDGFKVDTNAAWLGQRLLQRGVTVVSMASVRDEQQAIEDLVSRLDGQADIVIVTGGLGPTPDDVTKAAFCSYFHSDVHFDENYWQVLVDRFRQRGYDIPDNNRSQAEIPTRAKLLSNSVGTAPGLEFDSAGTTFYVLPGVPAEMEAIMREHVLPGLGGGASIPWVTLRTAGMFESALAERLAPLLPEDDSVRVAFLPEYTGLDVRIRGVDNSPAIRQRVGALAEALESELGGVVYGRDDVTMEAAVGTLLSHRKETLAVAESSSGGLVSSRLTDIPGASAYLLGAVVAYSNEAKIAQLGVRPDTLETQGAVSEPIAREMAAGVQSLLGTHWGVATTGIAGPGGGTADKPVGLVFVAVSGPHRTVSREAHLVPDRIAHKAATAQMALNLLRQELLSLE